jgi:uncharacterized membrane protein YbhN (UPF0104 family)
LPKQRCSFYRSPLLVISRKQLRNLLRMAFGLGVLVWIARQIDYPTLASLVQRGDPWQLALGVGSSLVALHGLQWARLHLLIRGYTSSLATSIKIFYVGALFNNFLPSNVGGDAIRMLYLQGLRSENLGTPFMLMVLYRVTSFAVLMLAGLAYVALEWRRLFGLLAEHGLRVALSPSTWLLGALALGALVLAFMWLRARHAARVREFARGCRAALALLSAMDVFVLLAETVLFHFLRMLSFFHLVRFGGQHVALGDLVFVVSATAVVSVLPITIAGLGVIEASITGLLGLFGVELSCAAGVALVNRAVMLLAAAIGGMIYLLGGALRQNPSPAPERVT